MAKTLRSWLMRFWGNQDPDEFMSDRVTYNDALSLPSLWYALTKICEDAGMLPLDIKKETELGLETDYRHPAYKLLRDQANDFQTPDTFKAQVTNHAIMFGNGRAAIIRDDFGTPVELIPLLPDRTWTFIHRGAKVHLTKPDKEDDKDVTVSMQTDSNGYVMFSDMEVIHVMGFTHDGIEGMGLMNVGQTPISAGVNSSKYFNNQVKRGFRGKLFVEAPPGRFRDFAEAKEFIEEFNKKEGGSDNAYKAALLREGMKVQAVNMTNTDAQFAELGKFNRTDIGLLFGLDSMPGDGAPKTYNSLEQYNLMYGRALDRWLCKWELQCDMKLRTPKQKERRSHYFKFNRAAIHRTDLATTVSSLCNLLTHTVISPDEAREKLDMTKRPDGEGDKYVNPATTAFEEASGGQQTGQQGGEAERETEARNSRAVEAMLRSLIKTEANNAVRGAKAKNFVDSIERSYAKWEPKLAEKLEAIGLDRDLARTHCEESISELLEAAGSSTPENLEQNVKDVVSTWTNRVYKLIGEENDPA
jgi:HK97 family phage portal protein